ncbi:hypothetical protein RRG08_036082 [Elysia crispata]|uniref:Uncharacterized protein n=1 Tax=Elysia crispata TaxID=231223 RepID=A0AAE1AL21_9GAST|nr:hypothetical protein RRG08_036082 [Elysia crispata]
MVFTDVILYPVKRHERDTVTTKRAVFISRLVSSCGHSRTPMTTQVEMTDQGKSTGTCYDFWGHLRSLLVEALLNAGGITDKLRLGPYHYPTTTLALPYHYPSTRADYFTPGTFRALEEAPHHDNILQLIVRERSQLACPGDRDNRQVGWSLLYIRMESMEDGSPRQSGTDYARKPHTEQQAGLDSTRFHDMTYLVLWVPVQYTVCPTHEFDAGENR